LEINEEGVSKQIERQMDDVERMTTVDQPQKKAKNIK